MAWPATANDDVSELLKQVRDVGPQGAGSDKARAAGARLVAHGPAVLPALLEAMDTTDTVVANWLRTAFDRIVEEAMRREGKGIDADALLTRAAANSHPWVKSDTWTTFSLEKPVGPAASLRRISPSAGTAEEALKLTA